MAMLKTAFKFMKYDKPKSIGIIVGIVISIFLIGQQMSTLFFLTNLMGGLEIHSNSQPDDIWMIDELGKNINSLNTIDASRVEEVRSIEGVATSFPIIISAGKATFTDGKTNALVLIGSDGPAFVAGPRQNVIFKGNIHELEGFGNVAIEHFSLKTWETDLDIGDHFEINKKAATVRVVTKNAQGYGGFYVYTSLRNARHFSTIPNNQVTAVVVRPRPGADVQRIIDQINSSFLGIKAWRAGDIRDITINEIMVKTNTGTSFGSLVIFAIISGFFIIGLTMYSAVLDRLQDYGTLKAIGASNGYVSRLILMQAFLFALIGFAIAYGLLILFAKGVSNMGMTVNFDLPLTIGLFAVTVFMAVGGSLFAVLKIAKLEPASVF